MKVKPNISDKTLSVKTRIFDTDKPYVILKRSPCRKIGRRGKVDSIHQLTRWKKHLSEEMRRQLEEEQETQNRVLKCKQNSAGSEKAISVKKVTNDNNIESAGNASEKLCVNKLTVTNNENQNKKSSVKGTRETNVSARNKKTSIINKTIINNIPLLLILILLLPYTSELLNFIHFSNNVHFVNNSCKEKRKTVG